MKNVVIALSGFSGSGKDTLADFLVSRYCFKRMSFADPIKKICQDVFGFTNQQLWGPSEERNSVDKRWGISPRMALQTLGDDWGRKLHPDVWADVLMRDVKDKFHNLASIVVTDVRRVNEFHALKDFGALMVRVKRSTITSAPYPHASEVDMESIPDSAFDRIFVNDGTLRDVCAYAGYLVGYCSYHG